MISTVTESQVKKIADFNLCLWIKNNGKPSSAAPMGFFHQQSDISDISKQSSIALNSTMIPNQSLKMAEYLLCHF